MCIRLNISIYLTIAHFPSINPKFSSSSILCINRGFSGASSKVQRDYLLCDGSFWVIFESERGQMMARMSSWLWSNFFHFKVKRFFVEFFIKSNLTTKKWSYFEISKLTVSEEYASFSLSFYFKWNLKIYMSPNWFNSFFDFAWIFMKVMILTLNLLRQQSSEFLPQTLWGISSKAEILQPLTI